MSDGPEQEQEARDTSGTLFASNSGSGTEQQQLRQGNPRQPQSGPWVQPRPPYPGATGSLVPRVCPACGKTLAPTAVICINCGTAVASPRSKGVALVLAVAASFLTWLYTYQQDKTKFWWGFGLTLAGGVLSLFFVGIVMIFGVWLWAVISTALKPEEAFRVYPL